MSDDLVAARELANLVAENVRLEARISAARREGYADGLKAAANVAILYGATGAIVAERIHDQIRALDAGDAHGEGGE